MKKIIAVAALVVTLAGTAPGSAQAGGATSAALGLASFAVFNQLLFGLLAPQVWATSTVYGGPYSGGYYPPVVYAPPPAAYYPPPTYYLQQPSYAPPPSNEVVYPHGRYVLLGDGVTSAYQWRWIAEPVASPPVR